MEDLIRAGTLNRLLRTIFEDYVSHAKYPHQWRTGTGKTTTIVDTRKFIPQEERVLIIEDNVPRFTWCRRTSPVEARREQNGVRRVAIRDLLKARFGTGRTASFSRNSRGEAFDLLQLLNTGHSARCPPSTRIPHNKDLRASRVVFCKAVGPTVSRNQNKHR